MNQNTVTETMFGDFLKQQVATNAHIFVNICSCKIDTVPVYRYRNQKVLDKNWFE